MSFSNVLYKILALITLIFAVGYLYIHIYVYGDRSNVMTVAFLDVGQGDSILVETPNGAQILIDAGLNSVVLESLNDVLPFYDRSIDTILVSHPDGDHVGGFPSVLNAYKVSNLIHGVVFATSTLTEEIESKLKEDSLVHKVKQGDTIILDSDNNVYLEVLHPSYIFSNLDKNDSSIVARLVYGETEVMFTGDVSKKVEEQLVSTFGEELESDVLKVGHHGSDTSTADSFLGFLKPKYAIISAGKENKFGHPHKEVLNRLENFDVEVLQTKEIGTVVMQSDGEELWFK